MVLSHRKEKKKPTDPFNNTDGSYEHYVEQKKSDTEDTFLLFYVYEVLEMATLSCGERNQNNGCLGKGVRSDKKRT